MLNISQRRNGMKSTKELSPYFTWGAEYVTDPNEWGTQTLNVAAENITITFKSPETLQDKKISVDTD